MAKLKVRELLCHAPTRQFHAVTKRACCSVAPIPGIGSVGAKRAAWDFANERPGAVRARKSPIHGCLRIRWQMGAEGRQHVCGVRRTLIIIVTMVWPQARHDQAVWGCERDEQVVVAVPPIVPVNHLEISPITCRHRP